MTIFQVNIYSDIPNRKTNDQTAFSLVSTNGEFARLVSNQTRFDQNKQAFYILLVPDTIPGEVYAVLFTQIREVLLRLAGPPIRIKLARIEQELISLELQNHYIQVCS